MVLPTSHARKPSKQTLCWPRQRLRAVKFKRQRQSRDWLATLQLPTGLAIDVMMIVIAIVMAGGECQDVNRSQTDGGKMWAVGSNSPIGHVVNKRVQ